MTKRLFLPLFSIRPAELSLRIKIYDNNECSGCLTNEVYAQSFNLITGVTP